MELQVLVSTMYQKDEKIVEKMNIKSKVIIVNQCDINKIEEFNDGNIKMISLNERGVGLSRNTALMRATEDICIFADDDVEYIENYEKKIIDEFKKKPNADIILFNVPSLNIERPTYIIKKQQRVKKHNCLRYGAVNIAIRTESIKKANIYYSLLFGGGAKYSSGEDSLFIYQCIKAGLKVYSVPVTVGYVKQEESTWFKGYTEKYFIDKGAFFATLSKKWSKLLCFQLLIRHPEMWKNKFKLKEVYELMKEGIKLNG